MIFINACVCGVFAVKDGKILSYSLFKKDPEIIAEKMRKPEEAKEMARKFDEKVVSEFNIEGCEQRSENKGKEFLRKNFRKICFEKGFAKTDEELNNLINKTAIEMAKKRIKTGVKKDKLIVQCINTYNSLEEISNKMVEHLREWYGLHYPELKVKDHEKYAALVFDYGRRENFPEFTKSIGINIDKKDESIIKKYAKEVKNVFDTKEDIKKYLDETMKEIASNLNSIVGPVIGAKLIAARGSLKNLAKTPTSTIQVLGAEKALFRHMKGKGKPPKYGILHSHPEIATAKKDIKGKVARAIASKITMAVKTDYYLGKYKPEYKKELEKRIKEIKGGK